MSTLASVVIYDLFANLPAFGIPGRVFYASDTGAQYYDTGSAWQLLATGGGGGGNAIGFGTYASLPGSGTTAGDQYVCSDAPYLFTWTGTVWVASALGFIVTPPPTGWTSVNVGSSVFTQTAGVVQVQFQDVGANSFKGYAQVIPGATWTITVGIKAYGKAAGVGLYDSVSGKSMCFFSDGAGKLDCFNYAAGFAFTSRQLSDTTIGTSPEVIFLRIVEDVTNRTFYISHDGLEFFQWAQVAAGTFVIPTHLGFASDVASLSIAGASIFSFKTTTP